MAATPSTASTPNVEALSVAFTPTTAFTPIGDARFLASPSVARPYIVGTLSAATSTPACYKDTITSSMWVFRLKSFESDLLFLSEESVLTSRERSVIPASFRCPLGLCTCELLPSFDVMKVVSLPGS